MIHSNGRYLIYIFIQRESILFIFYFISGYTKILMLCILCNEYARNTGKTGGTQPKNVGIRPGSIHILHGKWETSSSNWTKIKSFVCYTYTFSTTATSFFTVYEDCNAFVENLCEEENRNVLSCSLNWIFFPICVELYGILYHTHERTHKWEILIPLVFMYTSEKKTVIVCCFDIYLSLSIALVKLHEAELKY